MTAPVRCNTAHCCCAPHLYPTNPAVFHLQLRNPEGNPLISITEFATTQNRPPPDRSQKSRIRGLNSACLLAGMRVSTSPVQATRATVAAARSKLKRSRASPGDHNLAHPNSVTTPLHCRKQREMVVVSKGDSVWYEPPSDGEFDLPVGGLVLAADAGQIQIRLATGEVRTCLRLAVRYPMLTFSHIRLHPASVCACLHYHMHCRTNGCQLQSTAT